MKSISLLLAFALCSFTPFAQTDPCASISVTGGNQMITVSGLSGAQIAGVQVFNSSWASVFSQTYTNPSAPVIVSPLAAGQYHVNVRLYTSNWVSVCEKVVDATVTNNPPPAENCTFQKMFGRTGGDDMAIDLVKASDGGYLASGQSALNGNTNHDALLMKFDHKGGLIWSKTYGGNKDDIFIRTIATSDGGFLSVGNLNGDGFGTFTGEAWLIKTNANGNILWQKKYSDNTQPGFIYGITATSDGGYAFTGMFPYTPGPVDWMLIKIDANGNIQWQKKIGTSNTDESVGIVEDNHGGTGLVVSGYTYSGTFFDANLSKFDLANGNLMWAKSYDIDGRANRFGRMYKVTDGFLIECATHDGFGADNAVFMVVKTDFNGNIVLIKEIVAPGCHNGAMAVLPDGGIMIVEEESPTDATADLHLIRTDASANVLWTKKYPRAQLQFIYSLISDGNFAVGAGYTQSGSYRDLMLIKSDLSGNMGTCEAVSENSTVRNPVVTNLSFSWATLANLGFVPQNTGVGEMPFTPTNTTLCISDCDAPPAVSINNVTVNESAGNAVVYFCLSSVSTQTVTVQVATANGSALAGSDYTAISGSAIITPGGICDSIVIPILNDAIQEATENFTVVLSNPTNATIGNGTGTVTINDDDQSQINCNSVTITPGNNSIIVGGVTAPVATIQVFNSNWASVFNQSYTNSPGTVNIPIGPGLYHVKVTFYTSGWSFICDKNQDVTVVNQCPAGTICISNTCPSQTVNLNTAYSIPNLPPGTTVSWHTGTPATDGNKMTAAQAQNVSVSGTYYAAINISGANCYSQTIPVNVTIIQCTSPATVNAIEFKSEGKSATRKITVFPNPFTSSVRVIIDSEKKERATMMFTDLMGRQLQRKTIQLVPGSNSVMLEGLDKYPSGNYFLQIASPEGVKSFKLIRQQ